ncbi:hypothetical protein [Peribacillus frigoritolerans]|uniref:Uncharacterized protein n=1 Tax=Peribacillus castrilensis TaxID=2897690 RepID=A0AAW9NBE6_9BACI|nr:hypothetical protein [Peribacillus castrilensis]
MEWKVRDSCGKARPRETPQANGEGGPPGESECPRKASAWSGNQRSSFTNKKT